MKGKGKGKEKETMRRKRKGMKKFKSADREDRLNDAKVRNPMVVRRKRR